MRRKYALARPVRLGVCTQVCKRRAQVRKCVGKTKKLKKLKAKLAGKKAPVSG